ncbi:hypothetical protein BGX34_005076 [Mortierella sp. NVP85]|nr:hypothetical protein BGX34_005076 [Mortierella sp. NVP85]
MSDPQRGLEAFERLAKADEGVRAGSCRKCGGSGHLTFECRNFIKLDHMPEDKPKSGISSRFGFLKKQLGSSPASGSGASTPTRDGHGSGSVQKSESSSGRKKKKRRHSVSSSESDSSSSSDDASSESSDSEDDRKRDKKRRQRKKESSTRRSRSSRKSHKSRRDRSEERGRRSSGSAAVGIKGDPSMMIGRDRQKL